jgi:DNA-binding response OmpR family regulator
MWSYHTRKVGLSCDAPKTGDDMKKNIEILLVEGDEITRRRLRDSLEAEEGLRVMADCGNAEEAFDQVRTLAPDIILMGIWLSDVNGIEATRRLKKNSSSCSASIVILAECADYLIEALEAGAAGYLPREVSNRWLSETIKEVYHHKHSSPRNDCLVQEIELSIPLLVDAGRLLRFVDGVQDTLHATIVGTVSSRQEGTDITLSLRQTTLGDVLDKLCSMSDVEKVEVPGKAWASLMTKFMPLLRPRRLPKKKLLVTLRQADILCQKTALVLN